MQRKMMQNFPLQVFLGFELKPFPGAMKTRMRKPDAEQSLCDSKSFEDEADLFSVSKKRKGFTFTEFLIQQIAKWLI